MNEVLPWSYSRLSVYEKCPRQFAFRYIEKVAVGKRETSPQMERGTNMHNSIEQYLLGATKGLHPEVEHYRQTFKDLLFKNATPEQKIGLDYNWQLVGFDSPTTWVRGVLDTRFNVAQTASSFEWKSGKKYEDHADQRWLYLLFLRALHPKAEVLEVKTVYLDLKKEDQLIAILPRDNDEVEEKRKEFVDRMHMGETDTDYAARPGYYCSWCPYSRYKEGPCSIG